MRPLAFVEHCSPRLASVFISPAARQLIRYALAGLCVTQFAACVYSAAVLFLRVDPIVANVISTSCGLVAGYLVHSRWSFGNGQASKEALQVGRFVVASIFAFVINSIWVLLLTTVLRLPPLAPVPLMILATPWFSFLLNRYWVFKAA